MYALRQNNWSMDRVAQILFDQTRLAEIEAEAAKAGINVNPKQENSSQTPVPVPHLDAQANQTPPTNVPSWMLSHNPSHFERLFSLMSVEDSSGSIQSKVWDLLLKIPSAAHITGALFAKDR